MLILLFMASLGIKYLRNCCGWRKISQYLIHHWKPSWLIVYHFPLLQKDSYPVESKVASLQEKRPRKPNLSLIFLASLIPYPFGPCPLRRAPNLPPILPIQTRKVLKLYCSVQFNSVAQLCPTLCDPMNRSTPGLPVHHQLPEFTEAHVHWVNDAIQPSHPLSSPSPPAPNPSQHQSLFQWVNSSHEVAKVLEFQL